MNNDFGAGTEQSVPIFYTMLFLTHYTERVCVNRAIDGFRTSGGRVRWRIAESDAAGVAALGSALGVGGPAARVLWARGFRDPEKARRFFEPSLEDLHDPFCWRV